MNFIESIAYSVSRRSRERKWQQFIDLMAPQPTDKLVDVGVNAIEYSETDNYLERHYPYPHNITAVGIESDFTEFKRRYPKVAVVTGDGVCLQFDDDSFDIACSNAVIEHVGGFQRQVDFLRELYRVGKRGYITSPNRFFPIEVHTRIPLLHIVFSKPVFDRLVTALGKGWAAGDYMHLLSARELHVVALAAGVGNYEIIRNRFLGFTMTFTLVWEKKPCS